MNLTQAERLILLEALFEASPAGLSEDFARMVLRIAEDAPSDGDWGNFERDLIAEAQRRLTPGYKPPYR